jgi:hypothetical protein
VVSHSAVDNEVYERANQEVALKAQEADEPFEV